MRHVSILLFLVACPKGKIDTPVPNDPVTEAVDQGPRNVSTMADVAGAAGIRATVTGVLSATSPEGIEGTGTAVVLGDGTAVYVSEGDPPASWAWLMGTRVRVQGVLWETPQTGWAVPTLLEVDSPMPADVDMPMMPPL